MKRLLLIGAQEIVLRTAKKLGFEVILFEKDEKINDQFKKIVDEYYVIEWEDPKLAFQFAKSLHNKKNIDIVYSFGERGVKTAAYIKDKLGVRGNDLSSVNLTSDKYAMRNKLESLNISPVTHMLCNHINDLEICADNIGYPLIIKPNTGTGSNGIMMFKTKKELSDFIENKSENLVMPVLLEEFLEGEEISVETISFQKNHSILGVTKKSTTGVPNFIETAHKLPANLDVKIINQIEKLVSDLLNAINYTEGLSHIEIKITNKGPKIIEAHVRPGGDRITELLNISYDIDVFYEVLNYLKMGEHKITPLSLKKHSSIRYILLPKGRITKIEGLDFLKNHPNIIDFKFSFKEGDLVDNAYNSKTRHGYYLVVGNTENELYEHINQIRDKIIIEVDNIQVGSI